MTYQKIHELISADGYDGIVASLRMFMQKERIRHAELEQDGRSKENPKEYIQRKSLSQLLYKKLNDVYTITKEQYDQVLKSYLLLAELYSVIKELYEIIYSKHSERLDLWLQKLEALNILELQTYVNGIRKDVEAVKNAIENEYNNGLAEGSVNKIKVIKRIMYGRNSFELLKAKILFHEQFYCEFN
ncbi:MAG: transposase [Velocimicrobium sp.]